MTKKTVLGLLVIGLLFGSGFVRRNVRPNYLYENERRKDENADLRTKNKQLDAANDKLQKDAKQFDETTTTLKAKIKELEGTNGTQQAALAALRTKIKELEAINDNQLKEIQKIRRLSTKTVVESNIASSVDETVKISKPIFGIYLGEKLDELGKRYTLGENIRQDKNSNGGDSSEDITKSWSVEPNDPNISKIIIQSFEGNISHILVIFKDASEGHFETLKTEFKQVYGGEKNFGLNGIIAGEKTADFLPIIDGTQIKISIFYREKYGVMGVSFIHKKLDNKLIDELGSKSF